MGFRFQKRKGGESVDPYYRMSNRPLRSVITPVNTAIIAVNVIVFLWLTAAGSTHDALFTYNHGANYWPAVIYRHEYYQLLSCAFQQFGIAHLFNNMLVLGFLGDNLERALGRIRYAVFYLFCAVGSSAVSMAWSMYTDSRGLSAGASGAIFGVVGALVVILVRNHGRLEDLSSRQLILFAVFTIYHGITSAGIDNAAHLGGFVIGALLSLLIYRTQRSRRRKT